MGVSVGVFFTKRAVPFGFRSEPGYPADVKQDVLIHKLKAEEILDRLKKKKAAMTDVEIVKKGYLKDRYRSPQSNSRSSWFVFRIGTSASGRILDIYNSEKESNKKNAIAKDRIYLREIQNVFAAGNENPKAFYLTGQDGSVQNCLEAVSEFECNEWVFALNAVLFGKSSNGRNLIQFAVNVYRCSQYSYHGYGILEVRDDTLIVWTQGETAEVVRWKLGHLRSFKAKAGLLEIIAGSRSSTGEGVFTFGTQESVLITHTLETVIDRLARLKRAKNAKSQQALPPIPRPNQHSMPNLLSTPTADSTPTTTSGNNVTLVRGRTDTRNLIPGFSDIPDGSVRVNQQSRKSIPNTPVMPPPLQTYDTLRQSDTHASTRKSVSLGSIQPVHRDIYASDMEGLKTLKQAPPPLPPPMNSNDYSYVETDPKCILVSPTSDKQSLGFGEIRHSVKEKKQSTTSNGANIVTSDYFEADDSYSSLKPTDLTKEFLPQGLYNQLDFSKDPDDMLSSDSPPPPLPPPPGSVSPMTKSKGYENVGSTRSLPRIRNSSRSGLTDSAGSLEFQLDGSDSPKFMKKSKSTRSPRPSPRPSPRQSPTTQRQNKETEQTRSTTTINHSYDKVVRTGNTTKQFEFESSESGSSSYSTLGVKNPPEVTPNPISDLTMNENPYSQLARESTVAKDTSENEYGKLNSTSEVTNTPDERIFDHDEYSTFTRSISGGGDKKTNNLQVDESYSTLQSNSTTPGMFSSTNPNTISSNNPVGDRLHFHIQRSPSTSPTVPRKQQVEYEEVADDETTAQLISSHAYDQVDFEKTSPEDSILSSIYEDSFVDEHDNRLQNVSLEHKVNTEQQPVIKPKPVPPVPPKRGVSATKSNQESSTRSRPKPPPPVKPKPYAQRTQS